MVSEQPVNPYRKPAGQMPEALASWRAWPRYLQLTLGFMVLSLTMQLGQVLFAVLTARHTDQIQLVYGASSLTLSALALAFAWLRQRGSFVTLSLLVGCLHIVVTGALALRGLGYWLAHDTPGRVVLWNCLVVLVWSSFVVGLSVTAWRARR